MSLLGAARTTRRTSVSPVRRIVYSVDQELSPHNTLHQTVKGYCSGGMCEGPSSFHRALPYR